jgi:cytochrome c-type biogenesis protein CcmF
MLGRSLVLLAIAFAAWAGVAAPLSMRRRGGAWAVVRPELLSSARRAIMASCASLAGASLALWWALFSRDFSINYVAQYTSRAQRPWYVLSAFWAGMDGSMLLWCLILSIYAAAFVRRRSGPATAWAIPFLAGPLVFFSSMTAGPTDPFRHVDLVPADGRGLNPLLESPAMLIHPPLLYTGYIGLLVPFAIVASALITRDTGTEWLRVVRRYTLVPWLALGAGMTLGGAWAYTELGWGGMWGWDPVENAALMPWLLATAFLHSAVVQERRGMLKTWNVFLVLAASDLAIFGTFLTRSGLLSSVHTFTESPLGRWYFAYLSAQSLIGLGLLAWRLPHLRSQASLGSPIARESGFLLNNLVFLGAAVTVLWGTVLPLASEAATGQRIAVGPPFFNRVMSPIAALLLLLAAIGPLLQWRHGSAVRIARRLARPAANAAVIGMVALGFTRRGAFAGLVALAALAAAVAAGEILAGARVRGGANQAALLPSLLGLLSRNPRRYGGYVVHIGIAVMAVGFAGALFRGQADVTASPGETVSFRGYAIRFDELRRYTVPDKNVRMAVLEVRRGGRRVATLRPQQNVHLNFDQPQSEIAIRTTPREDLYVVLTGTSGDQDRSAFRIYVNPLMFWIWVGAALAVTGGLLALLAGGRRTRRVPIGATERSEAEALSTR